jgi:DNA adenine methylase
VPNYIEPFAGSCAVMLARPHKPKIETVNDLAGFVSNIWRAVKHDPCAVAKFANSPVFESDLHARHSWLKQQRFILRERLEGNPNYFDAKIAGWWVWGMSCWIGGGWCSDSGPWGIEKDEDGIDVLVKGCGPDLRSNGISRKRPALGRGVGVNRSSLCEGKARRLNDWMNALSKRFANARVLSGDWSRVVTEVPLKARKPCGVFLDPPYAGAHERSALYPEEDFSVAHSVRKWCIEHGNDPDMRIALCGYLEHDCLADAGWTCVPWETGGGYANIAKSPDSRGKRNAKRERIWFSPFCQRAIDELRSISQVA